jgi:hypothetical protein
MPRSVASQIEYGDDRPNSPVTLEQMRVMVDRAERYGGLSVSEATRFRRGLDQVAETDAKLTDLEDQNRRLIKQVKRLCGLFGELDDMVAHWRYRADILDASSIVTTVKRVVNQALMKEDPK